MWRHMDPAIVFDEPSRYNRPPRMRALVRPPLFVDASGSNMAGTSVGVDTRNGKSWDRSFLTMTAALAAVQTGGTIYVRGKITEECAGSNLKFDVSIVGVGGQHHADQPGSGTALYDTGACVWQPPGTPTAATPLLEVRGRGWTIENILFDCPVDAAAIKLMTGTGSGLTEYDANHASIIGCDFRNGLYGIADNGGCFNVRVIGNTFETLDATSSGAGIRYTATINAPRRWIITDNYFQGDCDAISGTAGSERHIVSPLGGSLIKDNVFGTVKGTGLYIDLTGGAGNSVVRNVFGGAYDTTDYVAGTGDLWLQNAVAVKATTAPDGLSLSIPVGP